MTDRFCQDCAYFKPTEPPAEREFQFGLCWRFPQWQSVDHVHYCGEFVHKPDDPRMAGNAKIARTKSP